MRQLCRYASLCSRACLSVWAGERERLLAGCLGVSVPISVLLSGRAWKSKPLHLGHPFLSPHLLITGPFLLDLPKEKALGSWQGTYSGTTHEAEFEPSRRRQEGQDRLWDKCGMWPSARLCRCLWSVWSIWVAIGHACQGVPRRKKEQRPT